MIKNKYPTIKPSLNLDFANTKSLDPRITFRRGTPGTYYDGVTHVKAEENLLSYSEDFSKWGSVVRLELTANETAPDGSSTAYKIAQASGQTSSGATSELVNMNKGENYTYSIYAKAGTNRDYLTVRIYDYSIADHYQYFLFDLGNGQTLDNGIKRSDYYGGTHDIQDVGNGWYRCIVSFPVVNDSSSGFLISNFLLDTPASSTVAVADDGGFIYVWGAQLEQRDTVTSYTATNSAPITKYQPKLMTAAADHARFDHDPLTGESKGLLIEERRTNLHRRSEDFVWGDDVSYQSTLISNSLIAPDGQLSATKVEYDPGATGGGYSNGYRPGTSSGQILTGSMYFKEGSLSKVNCFFNIRRSNLSSLASYGVNVDLSQGSIVSQDTEITSSSIINAGNGWYRVSWSATMPAEAAQVGLSAYMYDTTISPSSYLDGFYIWGAQLEVGSFATSYIKTTGASATRSADNASITGENFSSWYRQDEGSIYVDSAKGNLGTSFAGYVSLHTEDFSNSGYYWLLHNSSNQFQFLVAPGIASLTDGIDASLDSQKACVSWADDDFSMSVNGNTIQSDTDGPAKKNLTGLRIGFSPYSNSHYLNSHIKKLAYYPQRLTNEQLQNLTK